jgi:hypothetical protein
MINLNLENTPSVIAQDQAVEVNVMGKNWTAVSKEG